MAAQKKKKKKKKRKEKTFLKNILVYNFIVGNFSTKISNTFI